MLKRNKAIAIALAFVFCMSFIAPALIAPSVAQAAEGSYSGDTTFETGKIVNGQITVSVAEIGSLPLVGERTYGDYLTVTLPSGIDFADGVTAITPTFDPDKLDKVDQLGTIGSTDRSVTFSVFRKNKFGSTKIIIPLKMKVGDVSDEVKATLGGTGVFQGSTSVLLGNAGSGSATASINSVKSFGVDESVEIDDIIISEISGGAFKPDDVITLELSKGFKWNKKPTLKGEWGLSTAGFAVSDPFDEGEKITITLPETLTPTAYPDLSRLIITGAQITDKDSAKKGEVTVEITSEEDIIDMELVVAKYGDFGVTLTEDAVAEVTAGKKVEIGSFFIEETIAKSLVAGRSVNFDLPSGVKWTDDPKLTAKKGVSDRLGYTDTTNKGQTLKYKVKDATGVSKLLVEKGEVYIEPGFEGPIEVTVTGTAGVEGTVKVAEVKPAVTIKAEGVKDVVVGSQNQKVADILIVENDKEAILKTDDNDEIVVALDEGYKFYKKPVVEVTEGDLEIDSTKLNSSNDELTIKIKSDSSEASTIKLSDVYVTGFRSAPEGPVKAILVEAEGDVGEASVTGSTALDEGYEWYKEARKEGPRFSEVSAGEVVIANCVTPAGSGASISFKVGSNIYTVNGVNKVMDASPYIKSDRTYVPMRYVAESLGAEVVWDQTAQTVTLTKGDTVVVFTIGSTTYTVNGESAVADVAPEITSDRTMLPARYAAEALGAVVGWDQATQTVIITQ